MGERPSFLGLSLFTVPLPRPPSPVRSPAPSLTRAQFVHPTLNKHFLSDTAWTFSMYLESMAIVPQLFMFQKQAKGIVEVIVSFRVSFFSSWVRLSPLQRHQDLFLFCWRLPRPSILPCTTQPVAPGVRGSLFDFFFVVLWTMRRQVTHSTFALGLARVLDMVFWMFSYKELTSHAGSNSVGMFVLFAQFVHIAIMGDFFYYYAIR